MNDQSTINKYQIGNHDVIVDIWTMPNPRSGVTMTREVVNELIDRRVAEALEARDVGRNLEPLVKGSGEQEDENGDDYKGGNGGVNGNRVNGNRNGIGNGNGNDNRNGNGNGGVNGYNFGGFMLVAREYTYQDFLKCQPLNFNGTEGVFLLTHWFEKMETVFHIRVQELVLLCTRMVPYEEDKVERFIRGLPDNIQGNLKGYARCAENKRRFENNPRDNRGQQPAFKKQNVGGQNVARAYTA
ncbi:hypothetical protein Tco_1049819 [Tanacetum coccineum]